MDEPPDREKEHQQHAIHSIRATNMALFGVSPSTSQTLKGGLDPPVQEVLVDALATCWQIGNDEQAFFLFRTPPGTQIGLNLLFLPQTNIEAAQ